jgi:hypothetical protein
LGNQLVALVELQSVLAQRLAAQANLTHSCRLLLHRSQPSEPLALLVAVQQELVGRPQ